ncbi:MAG: hypothetical protein V4651_06320 [Bacteroidota bacterium]
MKTYLLMVSAFIIGTISANAQQVKAKLIDAREDMIVAKADLKQAQKDSIAEYRQFRKESLEKISENNKTIGDLRAKRADKEKIAAADYTEKVKELEDKNSALRESVNNYRADGNTNWVVFKREFNKQMDALRQSFNESRD